MVQDKTNRIFWRYGAILCVLSATACTPPSAPAGGAFQSSPTPTRHITFVHWTDPHVFDAGKGRHAEGVREEELDDWAAFHWAVLETNRMVLAEHRDIDFVVITGDFGLENVLLKGEEGKPLPACLAGKPGVEGPIEMVPMSNAVAEVARELDALLVKQVYLVPGNNDLRCENANDLSRWQEFVSGLQDELKSRHQKIQVTRGGKKEIVVSPGTVAIDDLADLTAKDKPPVVNGITLVGMNSAFFKSHDNKGDEKIKAAADSAIPKEIDRIGKQINPGNSYLIFTHIPDLKDPFPGPDKKLKDSWKLPKRTHDDWKKILSQSELLGVFAGHFHIAKRDLYPHNFAYSDPDPTTAAKFWLAPPLAEKYQWRSPPVETARGMLFVSLSANGDTRVNGDGDPKVQSSAIWYSAVDQKAAIAGDDKLAQARAAEHDGQWDDAAAKYLSVLSTAGVDTRTQEAAMGGYLRAREQMRSWWWQSPLAHWFYLNGMALLYTAAIVLVLIVAYALLRWILILKGIYWTLKWVLVPRFKGRATINDTVQLTENAPVKEFSALLQAEGEELRVRLSREKENWAAGHITLLAPSASSLNSLVDAIPKVQSLDVSAWMKFLLNLVQVFRWTVQTGLAVFPPDAFTTSTPAPPDKQVVVTDAKLSAYAILQWGSITRNSWWRNSTIAADRTAMRLLARELAELILGEAFARKRKA